MGLRGSATFLNPHVPLRVLGSHEQKKLPVKRPPLYKESSLPGEPAIAAAFLSRAYGADAGDGATCKPNTSSSLP